jgi:hypothetical protein
MDRDGLAAMPAAGPVPSTTSTSARPAARFAPSGPGRSVSTSAARSSRPAAVSCSRRPSAGSSSCELVRPGISGWCWRPGGSLPCCSDPGAGRWPIGSTCATPGGHPDALLRSRCAVVGAGRCGRGQRGGSGGHRRGRRHRPDRLLARPSSAAWCRLTTWPARSVSTGWWSTAPGWSGRPLPAC